jgi:hypothetical protein
MIAMIAREGPESSFEHRAHVTFAIIGVSDAGRALGQVGATTVTISM